MADLKSVVADGITAELVNQSRHIFEGDLQDIAESVLVHLEKAGYLPQILTTEDELHSLQWPMGTVVQEIHTGECCTEPFCDFYQPLWEMAFKCGWTRAGRMYDDNDDSPRLPVRVLWNPAVTHA